MKKGRDIKYRTKLITFFLLAVGSTILAGLYAYISSRVLVKDTTELYSNNMELTSVYKELTAVQQDLEIYLSTNSSDSLLSFYDHMATVSNSAAKLYDSSAYNQRGIKIKNISNMITHYLSKADKAVNAKRGRNIDDYTEFYAGTVKENSYIMGYIREIMTSDLIDSMEKSADINQKVQSTTIINIFLLAGVIIIVITAIFIFSIEITKPIAELAVCAKEISDGNFDVKLKPRDTSGEIAVLYRVFGLMAYNIKEYFNQIQERQRLEKNLSEQTMNNLKMKTLRKS